MDFVPETPYSMFIGRRSRTKRSNSYVDETPEKFNCKAVTPANSLTENYSTTLYQESMLLVSSMQGDEYSCLRGHSDINKNSFHFDLDCPKSSSKSEKMTPTVNELEGSSRNNNTTPCKASNLFPADKFDFNSPHIFGTPRDYIGDNTNILKDVTAYIQVISCENDRSSAFIQPLSNMGAKIAKKMGRNVTHVVFKNGSTDTYEKGIKYGALFVNPLWVEKCRLEGFKVDEMLYPINNIDAYQEPLIYGRIKLPKRWRCTGVDVEEVLRKRKRLIQSTPSSDAENKNVSRRSKRRRFRLLDVNSALINLDTPENKENKRECLFELPGVYQDQSKVLNSPGCSGLKNNDYPGTSKSPRPSKSASCQGLPRKESQSVLTSWAEESMEEVSTKSCIFKKIRRTTLILKELMQMSPDAHHNCEHVSLTESLVPPAPDSLTPALRSKVRSVAFTSVNRELACFVDVVTKLGAEVIHVPENTDDWTHLICGAKRRTLKLLYALAQGLWIVHPSWVYASLEYGVWAEEKDHEAESIYPVCKKYRQYKERHGKICLFQDIGPIFIWESTFLPPGNLRELVVLLGGVITPVVRHAHVVVGNYYRRSRISVSENWLLDCVEKFEVLPTDSYALTQPVISTY